MNKGYLQLDGSWNNCPVSWKNFMEELCLDGPSDRYGDVSVDYINLQLLPYMAKFIDDNRYLIEFESEAGLTAFLLRWS